MLHLAKRNRTAGSMGTMKPQQHLHAPRTGVDEPNQLDKEAASIILEIQQGCGRPQKQHGTKSSNDAPEPLRKQQRQARGSNSGAASGNMISGDQPRSSQQPLLPQSQPQPQVQFPRQVLVPGPGGGLVPMSIPQAGALGSALGGL